MLVSMKSIYEMNDEEYDEYICQYMELWQIGLDALSDTNTSAPENILEDVAEFFTNNPIDDEENQVTLDKRDLFCVVRGAIKNALTTDDNIYREAELWSIAHDMTEECLSSLYEQIEKPNNIDMSLDK